MQQPNNFIYTPSRHLPGVTALHAAMSDFAYDKHAHEEMAIGVTLAGRQDFSCKGSYIRSYPGHLILLNPHDVHNGNPGDEQALEYTMLYLPAVDFYHLANCASAKKILEWRIPEHHFLDDLLQSQVMTLTRHIALDWGTALDHELQLLEIVKTLTRRFGRFQPARRQERKDALLLRVRDFIHDNIAEEISINDLADVAHMSKYHLIRMFRAQFGLTPHKYILNCRVNKVKNALEQGAAPIDAAQDYCFFDVSHMNRHFKRVYGLTPRQYQLQSAK